jgi:TRAP-type C4-dicarboxylate transport system substrate-binding protein
MKIITRTLTGLACAIGLGFGASAMAAEKVNIGIVTGPNFVHTVAAQKFKEELDKALPGKYDVIVHHSAALGSETQVLQQLQLGTVQMSVCTTGPIEAFVPEIKALEMPFLFSSYEASDKVLDGPIGQDWWACTFWTTAFATSPTPSMRSTARMISRA